MGGTKSEDIIPDKFGVYFLEGDFEKIYKQTSQVFQDSPPQGVGSLFYVEIDHGVVSSRCIYRI